MVRKTSDSRSRHKRASAAQKSQGKSIGQTTRKLRNDEEASDGLSSCQGTTLFNHPDDCSCLRLKHGLFLPPSMLGISEGEGHEDRNNEKA